MSDDEQPVTTHPAAQQDRTDRGLSVLPEIRSTNRPRPAEQPEQSSEHVCRDGWLGTEDQPRPCPVCRPHLRRGRYGWRVTTDPDRRTP